MWGNCDAPLGLCSPGIGDACESSEVGGFRLSRIRSFPEQLQQAHSWFTAWGRGGTRERWGPEGRVGRESLPGRWPNWSAGGGGGGGGGPRGALLNPWW